MNQELSHALERLKACFPKGYLNYNNEFIADRLANKQFGGVCCRLHNCDTVDDLLCAVIESLSYDCCKSRPFKTATANVDFRIYMLAGMNKFLGTSFTENDFLIVYTHLGFAINRKLTSDFVRSGYDLELLKSHKRDRMISVDQLLETINGLEYRARSLEQMRGGNDVLRRLLPQLINQQTTLRILSVTHCGNCDFWKRHKNEPYGRCKKYNCTKHNTGYCDIGKEKEGDDLSV